MRTPTRHNSQSNHDENLARFRYHTGGTLRRLDPDEKCPILFRDVGVDAMIDFLKGELNRLCGPTSPITYLRDCNYIEPYTDHGMIGRIMLLQPMSVSPWHSGQESIYVARRQTESDYRSMVFLPSHISFHQAASELSDCKTFDDVRESLGPADYRDAIESTSQRLFQLRDSHLANEELAAPLRQMFQSGETKQRETARQWMEMISVDESDLCTAWHHLPINRREHLQESMQMIRGLLK